jgi:hypothetical protein
MLVHSFLAISITLSILSALLCLVHNNTVLAVSVPSFVDPFTTTQSLPTSKHDEICNDGLDNDGNGLVDENCGSESITKLVEGISNREIGNTNSPLPNDENLAGEQLPEQEICNNNQDNDGNGVVDENCGVSNNNDENQNTVIPEQEICGDLKDNDGNGLADEMSEINTTPKSTTRI